MEMNIKQRIAAAALALALLGGTAAPALAGERGQQGNAGGSLVAAVIQVADTLNFNDTNVEVLTVDINDSLNNLTALNNILNNSPILNDFLNDNTVVITDVVDIGDVDVDILSGLNVDVNDVLAVVLLSTGDILVLV